MCFFLRGKKQSKVHINSDLLRSGLGWEEGDRLASPQGVMAV